MECQWLQSAQVSRENKHPEHPQLPSPEGGAAGSPRSLKAPLLPEEVPTQPSALLGSDSSKVGLERGLRAHRHWGELSCPGQFKEQSCLLFVTATEAWDDGEGPAGDGTGIPWEAWRGRPLGWVPTSSPAPGGAIHGAVGRSTPNSHDDKPPLKVATHFLLLGVRWGWACVP